MRLRREKVLLPRRLPRMRGLPPHRKLQKLANEQEWVRHWWLEQDALRPDWAGKLAACGPGRYLPVFLPM